MKEEKLLAILRLEKTKSIGDILSKKLISEVGDVTGVFKQSVSSLKKIKGIGTYAINHIFNKEYLKSAELELEYIIKNNIKYTYFLDDDYPKNLKNCIDGPLLLFKDGKLDFTNNKIISIVGTRNMSSYGKDFCVSLIEHISKYNPIIVSGFAYGVDICAHKTAIDKNLQTIAVLAHGFEQIYPKTHKKYISQLNKNGGFFNRVLE